MSTNTHTLEGDQKNSFSHQQTYLRKCTILIRIFINSDCVIFKIIRKNNSSNTIMFKWTFKNSFFEISIESKDLISSIGFFQMEISVLFCRIELYRGGILVSLWHELFHRLIPDGNHLTDLVPVLLDMLLIYPFVRYHIEVFEQYDDHF